MPPSVPTKRVSARIACITTEEFKTPVELEK